MAALATLIEALDGSADEVVSRPARTRYGPWRHMARSVAERCSWSCPYCPGGVDSVVWLTIDADERPDLLSLVASGAWMQAPCERCGRPIDRPDPLLVTRLDPAAPLLMAFAEPDLRQPNPLEPWQALLDRVRERAPELARPVLIVPFHVLMMAAGRDISADLANPPGAPADYEKFLRHVRDIASDLRIAEALTAMFSVRSAEELAAAVAAYPELRSPEARRRHAAWLEHADDEEERQVAAMHLRLLDDIRRGDLGAAWRHYEAALSRTLEQHPAARVEQLLDELGAPLHEPERLVAAGEELLELAQAMGEPALEWIACGGLGSGLLHLAGPGQAERIDQAIALYTTAVRILSDHPELADRTARIRMIANLGTANGWRIHGDPVANQERGADLQRSVLELAGDDHPNERATAQTNLGLSLLKLASLVRVTDGDDAASVQREVLIDEAVEQLEAALTWRSFERDPFDWAYTQLNLGLAYVRRGRGDRTENLRAAIAHYEAGARGFTAAGRPEHAAQALHNLASDRHVLAHRPGISPAERAALLDQAADEARAALAVRRLGEVPLDAARDLRELGRIEAARDHIGAALDAYGEALSLLDPEETPRITRSVAEEYAVLAEAEDHWDLAAVAWEQAARATAFALSARTTSAGRADELHESVMTFRAAAYALVRVGRAVDAVRILELGRARELAATLHHDVADLDTLRHLDPELHAAYLERRADLDALTRRERTGVNVGVREMADAAEALDQVLRQIRAMPGLERFLLAPMLEDLVAQLPQDEALVYVMAGLHGALALIVRADATVDVIEADFTSGELAAIDEDAGEVGPLFEYYLGQATGGDALDAAIDRLADRIGPALLAPLAERLARHAVTTVHLIPVGLLGNVPLHALSWPASTGPTCLLDQVQVTFAPSAFVQDICTRRAANRRDPGPALIVGNPLPHSRPLEGAEEEARLVAARVPSTSVTLLLRTEATKDAVLGACRGASLVHFSCHGSATILEPRLNAALSLADEVPLTAQELFDLDDFAPRLAVASACETGVVQGYETADEALTIGTVMLAAGAAGSVATLWSVDDQATALLMVRFYDGIRARQDPAAALREAQLWLRTQTVDSPWGLRSFAAPRYWAAFVLNGR